MQESMSKVLRIDPEFQNKIPPLTDKEYEQLEENILEAGEVREPIITWNGVIVDGHNRYKIVQKHPEIKWKTLEMKFADKWEAIEWMCKNQLGRRNLTEQQMAYLAGKMYEASKHNNGGQGANQYTVLQVNQNDKPAKSESQPTVKKKTQLLTVLRKNWVLVAQPFNGIFNTHKVLMPLGKYLRKQKTKSYQIS